MNYFLEGFLHEMEKIALSATAVGGAITSRVGATGAVPSTGRTARQIRNIRRLAAEKANRTGNQTSAAIRDVAHHRLKQGGRYYQAGIHSDKAISKLPGSHRGSTMSSKWSPTNEIKHLDSVAKPVRRTTLGIPRGGMFTKWKPDHGFKKV